MTTDIDMKKAVGPSITTMEDLIIVVGGPEDCIESVYNVWLSVLAKVYE